MPKFNVEKSIKIAAPREQVFNTVRDFKQWPKWSPWLNAEPDCKIEYAADGKSYSWDGEIIGSGEMAILSEESPNLITYQLTFLKPWKSTSQVEFRFDSEGEITKATWTMAGSLPVFLFWMKKMTVAMIGMDYKRGLTMLKPYIESGSNPSKLSFTGETTQAACQYIGITTESRMEDLGNSMTNDFKKLSNWLKETNTKASGAPFSITHRFDMVSQITKLTAAIPIEAAPTSVPDGFIVDQRPETKTYAIQHTGPYHHVGNAWAAGMFRARNKAFTQNKKLDCFEIYENDPSETPENELLTTVHFPLK